ncbi:hypothetical protein N657DRAFT_662782 [Parathielavia appendiculata]|uniref:Uncharacterized protein n=1 Tax=Parathielavia appendiculata TaxID=2587402 RepID=A0AAN6Z715_9PEZI|nr:hypothetical protein N657DRAFT_662782 [Parathielavia appendiculata]
MEDTAMMKAAGQGESREQTAATTTTAPPPSTAQQPNSSDGTRAAVAAMPQPLASPAHATPAVNSPMDGVETTAEPRPANIGTGQPSVTEASSLSSHVQTAEDANKLAPSIPGPDLSPAGTSQPGDDKAPSQAHPANSMPPSKTATVASPQPPPLSTQQTLGSLQVQGTQPPPQPLPPQHSPAVPYSNGAPAPESASAPAPPAPAAHPHHGLAHPQPVQPQPQPVPRSHQYPQHPLPHPPPAPLQQQPQHTSHPQQLAPHPQTHAQIPPQYPSQQQQHHQHQYHHHHPPPASQHHHHHQPPPEVAHVTPVTHATPLPSLQQPHVPQFHSHPQPQPQSVLLSQVPQAHLRASLSKPIIMDPPSSRKSGQAQQHQRGAVGFPSPTQDHATINSKFVDDCTRMNYAIQQSLPEAVRRVVRDHWEKCLLGSEFHQAFVLNASIHHALPNITQRAVRDFGSKMVSESKHELMAHFTTEALDQVADLIISKASDAFLDRCLEKRLLTIEAQPLINALAKAERLGYEAGDMIQGGQNESVIPKEAYPGAAVAANGFQSGPAQSQPSRPPLQCMKCFRTFTHTSACDYHAVYDVCRQVPPTANGFQHSCSHCGQGFAHVNELQDHLNNKVCGNFGPPVTVSLTANRLSRPAPAIQPSSTTTIPSASQTPTANGVPRRQPQSTPGHSTTRAAGTPGSTGSGIAADPYGHLSEEQIQQMNAELREAEEKYAPRFAEANAIPDENARKAKLEGIRNSFGTKQSMIRKKYGVRLRERRTKAEIMAERERMGLQKAEKERAARAAAAASSQGLNANSRPAGGSGWTTANTPQASWDEHDAKRRRTDGSGGYHTPYKTVADETPTRKPLSVSEIGSGLSGAAATAAMHDPTLPPPSLPTKVYEQSGARVEIHEPARPVESPATAGARSGSATPSANGHNQHATAEPRRSSEKPLVIDDDSSSSDDEDIPSTLPAHVRKSLASGNTSSLLQTS